MDTNIEADDVPLVVFHRFVQQARLPLRADKAGLGSLPTRAFRYCEAIVTASAFGYYLFSPIDFSLMWDGTAITWTWEGADGWHPLSSAQAPGMRDHFDSVAPDAVKHFSPPMVSVLQEPGMVQLWSGYVARTRPGWNLLLRAPANVPKKPGFELFEGIVEADRWFGPLFGALRLTRTDVPIHFSSEYPLFQVQPLPRVVSSDAHLNDYEIVPELHQLSADDWADYHDTVVRPNSDPDRKRGEYAARTRRRRRTGEPARG